jgi:broad specificity phosphatase PhoE
VPSSNPVLYLARHGSADLTRTDLVYHLPPGPPLSSIGTLEASELASFLQQGSVGRIWTSPLDRARRTAEVAARACSAALVVDDRLIEMQPEETHDDVCARAWPVWEAALASAFVEGPQALVTHGGVVTALLLALGIGSAALEEYGHRFDSGNPLPPGGAWEVPGPDARGVGTPHLAFVPGADRAFPGAIRDG